MKKLMFPILMGMMLLTTGCAELSAIRQAAISELNAEVISEESAIYASLRNGRIVRTAEAPASVRKGGGLLDIAMAGSNGRMHGRHLKGQWE